MEDSKLESIKTYISKIMEIELGEIEYKQDFDTDTHFIKFYIHNEKKIIKITDKAFKDLALEALFKKISLYKERINNNHEIIITS